MRLVDRLLRRSRTAEQIAESKAARAEARWLHDEQVSDRSYVRFGPRNAIPPKHEHN
ncbi:MAG: hypothetical protein U0R50_07915 [Gaiellales bacterium]